MKILFNRIINYFFAFLVVVSIIGAIINLFNSLTTGGSSIYLLDVIILLAFSLSFLGFSFKNFLRQKYNEHRRFINIVLLIVIGCWQGYLINSVSGISSWDPSSIITAATSSSKSISSYLSSYPNNFDIFLIYHGIWKLLGEPSKHTLIIVISILNYLIFDIIFLCTFKFFKIYFKKSNSKFFLFTTLSLVGVSAWGCLSYSDLLAFDLTCLTIVSLFCLKMSLKDTRRAIIFAITSGILLALDYLVKPSLVITFIAFFIVLCTHSICNKSFKNKILPTVILLLSAFPLVMGVSFLRKNNIIIRINDNRSFNVYHYGAMGVYNNGGFNLADTNLDYYTKDPQKRKDQDIKLWKERLVKRGFTGYQSFLIRKQTLNTSDASFGWGQEGGFLNPFYKRNTLSHRLFFAGNPPKYANSYIACVQLIWIWTLFCMFINIHDNSFWIQVLKTSFVGFCLFLLIFEGGRSRYLIQFLPICFVLSAYGFNRCLILWKKLTDN